jgi:Mrp family chromosome partitioning ATPase
MPGTIFHSIERFEWPEICCRLGAAIPEQLDQAAEELFREAAAGRRVIGFAGCGRHVGCTTTLLALARRLVSRGDGVALFDAGGQSGGLADRIGAPPAPEGLVDGAAAEATVGAVVASRSEKTLVFAPRSGEAFDRFAADASALAGLLKEMSHKASLVLVDLGELTSWSSRTSAGAMIRSKVIGGVLVVCREGDVHSAVCRRAVSKIESCGVIVLGAIETFASPAARAA